MTKKGKINMMKKFKAFTMAEAILVMTILGIIAAVQITVIKPAKFKEKGYQVLAKTIYGEIDTAIMQVLTDRAPYNQMDKIYNTSNTLFGTNASGKETDFIGVLKIYLATARTGTESPFCKNGTIMHLKNGACIGVKTGAVNNVSTQIPGESGAQAAANYSFGMLYLDVNGSEEPNALGKDQYAIPLSADGIVGG